MVRVSLLDGRHEAVAYPLTQPAHEDDPPLVGAPVTVRGNLQPVSAELATGAGFDFTTTFRWSCREWPAGNMSRVVIDGRAYEQIGEPKRHRMSPATSHDVVFLKAVGTSWQE